MKTPQLNSRTVRAFDCVPKVLSAADGTVDFVASDESLDSYREIVRVNGWQFNRFQKNAPFVDSHDYSSIEKLLGQVTSWRVEGKQLVETVKYDLTAGGLGEKAFRLVKDGFLRAVSVGFIPVAMATRYDSNPASFQQQIAELGLDAGTASQLRAVYLKQEQIELSQCVIGANPAALAKAYKGGCLTDQDLEQLSVMFAKSQTTSAAEVSGDAARVKPRTKLALLMAIQAHL